MLKIATSLEHFTPVFLTQVQTERSEELLTKGYRVIHLETYNWRNPLLKIFGILLWNIAVAKLITHYKISVVHANDNQMVLRIIGAVKWKGVKWVVNIRDIFEPGKRYGWNRLWVNACDRIIVLSHEMKQELISRLPYLGKKRRLAVDQIAVIPSIVDHFLETPESTKKRGHFMANVVYVAAFNEKKNQLEFLDKAMPQLKKLNVCVHFVGDYEPLSNPYAKACDEIISKLELSSHVVLHGFQKQIIDYYKLADITIIPTKREGLARCMIESLACGTPVVSFDVCSAKEILTPNSCGVVIKQGDYGSLCTEVEKLIVDNNRYALMAANAIRVARELFNKEAVVQQYESIYQEG